jgi:hypothetical protein
MILSIRLPVHFSKATYFIYDHKKSFTITKLNWSLASQQISQTNKYNAVQWPTFCQYQPSQWIQVDFSNHVISLNIFGGWLTLQNQVL